MFVNQVFQMFVTAASVFLHFSQKYKFESHDVQLTMFFKLILMLVTATL